MTRIKAYLLIVAHRDEDGNELYRKRIAEAAETAQGAVDAIRHGGLLEQFDEVVTVFEETQNWW